MAGQDRTQVVKTLVDRMQQAPRLVAQGIKMILEAEAQLAARPPSPYPDSFPIITDDMTELQAAAAWHETLAYWHGQHAQGLQPIVTEAMLEQIDEETASRIYHDSIADPPTWSDLTAKPRGAKRICSTES